MPLTVASRALLSLSLVVWPVIAPALTYTPQTPVTVARDAAYVVIADVVGLEPAVTAEGAEIEWLTLEVREQWRGPAAHRLRVRQVRTVRDAESGTRAEFMGNPRLEYGRTYLVFLPPESELPTVPMTVAGELGAFVARRGPAGWGFTTLGGLPVVDVDATRWTYDTPPDARVVPMGGGSMPKPPPVRPGLAARWRSLVAGAR